MKEKDSGGAKKRSAPKIIAVTLIAAFVVFYIACQIYISVGRNNITTETALADSVTRTVSAKMFIVRDEKIISGGGENIVSAVKDGERVSVNDTVAYSFSDSSSADTVKRLNEVREQLDYYNSLLSKSSSVASSTDSYDDRIMRDLYSFSAMTSSGDFTNLDGMTEELRDAVTSKQTATGVQLNLSGEISALNQEYASLSAAASGFKEITAGSAGYYISGTDGYESALDYSLVDEWTVEDAERAISSAPASVSSADIGRVVHGYYWYLVCVEDTNEISGLSEGARKTIIFPDSSVDDIKAQVYSIRSDRETGKSLVIFRCNLMNEELASLRIENAKIVMEIFDGYRVDNNAIRVNGDNEKGVYVVSGSVMYFKKINIIYSADTYSIVTNPYKDDVTKKKAYLNLYDEYIVSGQNLEDGKYMD